MVPPGGEGRSRPPGSAPRTITQLTAALREDAGWDKHTAITMLSRLEAKGAVTLYRLDLDGDGHDELLLTACMDLNYWDCFAWDPYGKFCRAMGISERTEEKGAYPNRWL